MYMCKGAGKRMKETEKEGPLKPKQHLQTALAIFKIQCGRVRNHCIEEGDEHHLNTSTSKGAGRLRALGIDNGHAAIAGLPALDEKDALMVTQAILAMRGATRRSKG